MDVDDWVISDSFFKSIIDRWGPLAIDCFASYYNAKLPRFSSRFWNPGAEAIDAFAQDWSANNISLVPPVSLIPQALSHLRICTGNGVLVFPWWPSSPFWPLLWTTFKPFIVDMITAPGSLALIHGRNGNSLLGSAEFAGLVGAVKINIKININ